MHYKAFLWVDIIMSTITIVLDGQPIEFEITHYYAGLPATRWEPEEPEELEWQATDPAIQALIDHLGLHESVGELIREQAKRDAEDDHSWSASGQINN